MATKKLWRALSISLLLLLPLIQGAAQQQQKVGEASIPFEFWVGGNHLAAGTYRIENLESTSYFLFHSADGKTVLGVYVLPVDESPAKQGDSKLIFRVSDGKHYLYGGWGQFGRRVVSVESSKPMPSGDHKAEVPITYR